MVLVKGKNKMPRGIYKRTPEMKTGLNKRKWTDEQRKSLSLALKGKKHPRKWTDEEKLKSSISHRKENLSKETIEKMRLVHLGKKQSKEHIEKLAKQRRGRKASIETRIKLSECHRGEKSYLWKGGINPINKAIRKIFQYRQWRSDVFTRDDFTCQECYLRGVYLEAHHIKSFSVILKENNIKNLEGAINCEELWNLNNGITLCSKCHNKTKKGVKTI